ncbi:hypothetical protein [Massilia glaciei]|uniref:Uncharacterized protein n=1 Tax=Massilia glaciei TaxID=1524097 RepID=A0A2U2HMN5_9BURK|nr:hypothetical protein [Massilia glaciei]PWF48696.1 hypothetical protein C7C56_010325 [Massilia glaciei]
MDSPARNFRPPEPWIINSVNMNARDWSRCAPIGNSEIKDFLEPRFAHQKSILVARKGYGKSYILVAKAQLMHQAQHANTTTKIYPPAAHGGRTNWVEKLSLAADWNTFAQANSIWRDGDWCTVWMIAIASVAMRLLVDPEDLWRDGKGESKESKEFWKEFFLEEEKHLAVDGLSQLISTHLERVMAVDPDIRENWIGKIRSNLLTPLGSRLGGRNLVIFFDNPDEFLRMAEQQERKLGGRADPASESDETPLTASRIYPNVWTLAQHGLAAAIAELKLHAPSLYVYTSIRQEASAKIDPQLEDSLLRLDYTPEHLQAIFEQNILLCADDRLRFPHEKAGNPLKAFFGSNLLPHPRLKINGDDYPEQIFHALLRHSLMSPRDLMYFGKRLYTLAPAARLEQTAFDTIKATTCERLENFFLYSVPFWEDENMEFLAKITSNRLTGAEINALEATMPSSDRARLPVSQYLIAHGLLGTVKSNDGGKNKYQAFSVDMSITPESPYLFDDAKEYLVHPALDEYMMQQKKKVKSNYQPEKHLLVGYDLPYPTKHYFNFAVRIVGGELVAYTGNTPLSDKLSRRKTEYNCFLLLLCCVAKYKQNTISHDKLKLVVEKLSTFGLTRVHADNCCKTETWVSVRRILASLMVTEKVLAEEMASSNVVSRERVPIISTISGPSPEHGSVKLERCTPRDIWIAPDLQSQFLAD